MSGLVLNPAFANSQEATHKKWVNRTADSLKAFNQRCSIEFEARVPQRLKTPIRLAGTLVPVIPFFRAIADADRFFFLLIESPIISAVNSPASVALAKWLRMQYTTLSDVEIERFWSNLPREAHETYLSYIISSTVRNGITLSPELSEKDKYWLSWFFNASIYSLFTAGPALMASGSDPAQLRYACDMISFSMFWPLLSQAINQKIVLPVLFSRFPSKSILDKIYDTSISTEAILSQLDADQKFAEVNQRSSEVKSLKASKWWVKILRKDLKDGQKVSKNRRSAYWASKTMTSMATAVVMVSLYMVLRWSLVGTEASDPGLIDNFFRHSIEQGAGWFFSQDTLPQNILNEVLPFLHETVMDVSKDIPRALSEDPLLSAAGQSSCASPFAATTGGEAVVKLMETIKQ